MPETDRLRAEVERLTQERDELDHKLKMCRFLDEDAAEEETADEQERVDLVQLEAELRAHPHRALVESMAGTWQEVDDDDGNGGGSGWYQSLVLACIDQWIRDLREAGWVDPTEFMRQRQRFDDLNVEANMLVGRLLDERGEIERLTQENARLRAEANDNARLYGEACRERDSWMAYRLAERDVIEKAKAWAKWFATRATDGDVVRFADVEYDLDAAVDALTQPGEE